MKRENKVSEFLPHHSIHALTMQWYYLGSMLLKKTDKKQLITLRISNNHVIQKKMKFK